MVDGHGVGSEAAGRLDGDDHVAEVEAGEGQVAGRRIAVHRSGGRAPGRFDGGGRAGRDLLPPPLVVRGAPAPGRLAQLVVGEGGLLVREGVYQFGHEGVATVRYAVDPVSGRSHGFEQGHDRGRRVEGDGVADAAAPGGIGGHDDGHPALGDGDAPQPGQAQSGPGHAADPVGDGAVGGHRGAE